MLENHGGKLFVYASYSSSQGRRFEPVLAATEKMARHLKLGFEVKILRKQFEPIYVYYKNGDDEAIPICWVRDSQSSTAAICRSLKNMMFVLSFHPKHIGLRRVRKEIMQFS